MQRIAPVLAVFFVWAAPAYAKPTVNVQASATVGAAPLSVTLTASGPAATYHWDLGDGMFTATVTATDSGGETAQASVVITSAQLSLTGEKVGTYGRPSTLRGQMVPALKGAPITLYSGDSPVRTTKLDKEGHFAVRLRQSAPATYTARFETVASNAIAVAVRPGLDVAVPQSGMPGRPLVVRAVLRPRSAGTLHVRVWRSGHELTAKDFGGRAVESTASTRTTPPTRCSRFRR